MLLASLLKGGLSAESVSRTSCKETTFSPNLYGSENIFQDNPCSCTSDSTCDLMVSAQSANCSRQILRECSSSFIFVGVTRVCFVSDRINTCDNSCFSKQRIKEAI